MQGLLLRVALELQPSSFEVSKLSGRRQDLPAVRAVQSGAAASNGAQSGFPVARTSRSAEKGQRRFLPRPSLRGPASRSLRPVLQSCSGRWELGTPPFRADALAPSSLPRLWATKCGEGTEGGSCWQRRGTSSSSSSQRSWSPPLTAVGPPPRSHPSEGWVLGCSATCSQRTSTPLLRCWLGLRRGFPPLPPEDAEGGREGRWRPVPGIP